MKKRNGFTVIEIVLVLAIAGLIFLATFIALPSLWASQRDSARKENLMMFVTNLKNYQTNNNRGALPGGGKVTSAAGCMTDNMPAGLTAVAYAPVSDQNTIDSGTAIWVSGSCADGDRTVRSDSIGEQSWAGFYRDYMKDSFEDPAGHRYNLYVANCESSVATLNAGQNCNNMKFNDLIGVNNINNGGSSWTDYVIYVAVSATCDGDTAVKSLNNRKVAVVYKMERGGQYCYSS